MAGNKEEQEEKPAESAAPAVASGKAAAIKGWLPLIVTLVTMPILAYATTAFVLVPKLKAIAAGSTAQHSGGDAADAHGEGSEGGESAHGEGGGSESHAETKTMVPLSKLLVNVAGTRATRYLMTSMTLVGHSIEFKAKVESNDALLKHVAGTHLSTKTITDLEKPGARNLIQSELISLFNEELGKGMVRAIYFTEFAVQ